MVIEILGITALSVVALMVPERNVFICGKLFVSRKNIRAPDRMHPDQREFRVGNRPDLRIDDCGNPDLSDVMAFGSVI